MIRERLNEELSRNIINHLKESGFSKVPSRSTVLKILKCLPARSARELHGK